jgi:hypothetical protein
MECATKLILLEIDIGIQIHGHEFL